MKILLHERDTSIPGNSPQARLLIGSVPSVFSPWLKVFFVPQYWNQSHFPLVPSTYPEEHFFPLNTYSTLPTSFFPHNITLPSSYPYIAPPLTPLSPILSFFLRDVIGFNSSWCSSPWQSIKVLIFWILFNIRYFLFYWIPQVFFNFLVKWITILKLN